MDMLIVYLGLCVVAGVLAAIKGRSGAWLFFLALFMWPISATAERVFDMAGLKIGDNLVQAYETGVKNEECKLIDPAVPGFYCFRDLWVDHKQVTVMYVFDERDVFGGLVMRYPSELHEVMVKAYTGKFKAPPDRVESSVFTTQAGTEHQNETVTWDTKDGPFQIRRYGNGSSQGMAGIDTPQHRAINEQLESLSTKYMQDQL